MRTTYTTVSKSIPISQVEFAKLERLANIVTRIVISRENNFIDEAEMQAKLMEFKSNKFKNFIRAFPQINEYEIATKSTQPAIKLMVDGCDPIEIG